MIVSIVVWHINKVASACFFHIRRLKQIRRLLGPEAAATLIFAFVLSRLDYCNAVLAGLPKVTIAPLQRVQNAAARLIILRLALDYQVTTAALRHLHWLPGYHYYYLLLTIVTFTNLLLHARLLLLFNKLYCIVNCIVPVQYRITYKLSLLMDLIHIHKAPSYLKDIVTPTAI